MLPRAEFQGLAMSDLEWLSFYRMAVVHARDRLSFRAKFNLGGGLVFGPGGKFVPETAAARRLALPPAFTFTNAEGTRFSVTLASIQQAISEPQAAAPGPAPALTGP